MGVWLIGQGLACAGVTALALRYRPRTPLAVAPAFFLAGLYVFTNLADLICLHFAEKLGWYSHWGYLLSFGSALFSIPLYVAGAGLCVWLWVFHHPGNHWLGVLGFLYLASGCVNGDFLTQVAAIYPHFIDPAERMNYWFAQTILFDAKMLLVAGASTSHIVADLGRRLLVWMRSHIRHPALGRAKSEPERLA